MAWSGCPEWRALGHPTLGLPSFLACATPSAGAEGAHIKLLRIWPHGA